MHIGDVYSVAIPPHSLLMVSKDHSFWPSIAIIHVGLFLDFSPNSDAYIVLNTSICS